MSKLRTGLRLRLDYNPKDRMVRACYDKSMLFFNECHLKRVRDDHYFGIYDRSYYFSMVHKIEHFFQNSRYILIDKHVHRLK